MEKINLHELPQKLFSEDLELKSFLESLTDNKILDSYKQLPNFEIFISKLPEDVTADKLKLLLTTVPIEIRFLTAEKFSDFFTRCSNLKQESVPYASFKEFLYLELIHNNPKKLNWL